MTLTQGRPGRGFDAAMNETPPRPKKRLGQHFLTDKNILGKILSVAAVEKGDEVLEIGLGEGR